MAAVDPDTARAFTRSGALRAAIDLGNPVLAQRGPGEGRPRGVAVDLAQAWADRLGARLELVALATASDAVAALDVGRADIGFFAIDPARARDIEFTGPYLLVEGGFLVPEDSPLAANDEVDRAGRRVVVGRGSAPDLFLTRTLKAAQLLRAPTSPSVVDTLLAQRADVAAGLRQQLEADARRLPGLRLLPGRFMQIRQAVGAPRRFGPLACATLTAFVEEMKAVGFVAASLARHGVEDALAAP